MKTEKILLIGGLGVLALFLLRKTNIIPGFGTVTTSPSTTRAENLYIQPLGKVLNVGADFLSSLVKSGFSFFTPDPVSTITPVEYLSQDFDISSQVSDYFDISGHNLNDWNFW
jgi:hypothetical protein